jgi:hypothetical protein
MNERQEGLGKFVVARGDTSEVLDTRKEMFDQKARPRVPDIRFQMQAVTATRIAVPLALATCCR